MRRPFQPSHGLFKKPGDS